MSRFANNSNSRPMQTNSQQLNDYRRLNYANAIVSGSVKNAIVDMNYNEYVQAEDAVSKQIDKWYSQTTRFVLIVFNTPPAKLDSAVHPNIELTAKDRSATNQDTIAGIMIERIDNAKRLEQLVNMRSYMDKNQIHNAGQLLGLLNGRKYKPYKIIGVDISSLARTQDIVPIQNDLRSFGIETGAQYRVKVMTNRVSSNPDDDSKQIVLVNDSRELDGSIPSSNFDKTNTNRVNILILPPLDRNKTVVAILDGIDALNYAPMLSRDANFNFKSLTATI